MVQNLKITSKLAIKELMHYYGKFREDTLIKDIKESNCCQF